MADNVESIVPKLLAEIRDGVRDGFGKIDSRLEKMDSRLEKMDSTLEKVDSRLEKMDSRLEKMDSRLEKMDSRLGRVEANTRESRNQLGRLVGILSEDLADQLADVRRRLTTIEDRLDTR
jgi:chromosome segregation ATPase